MRGRYAPTRAIDAPSSVICSANATFPPRGRLFGWERPINGSISRAGAAQGAAFGRRATNPLLPVWAKGVFNLATYTEHYGLHQWESTDDFLRTDFNADFAAIDGALGAKCEMAVGSYVGDGEESRTISLPFQPQAVLLTNSEGETYRFPETTGGLALAGHPLASYQYGDPCLAVAGSGFQVGQSDRYVNTNATGMAYHYAAFR